MYHCFVERKGGLPCAGKKFRQDDARRHLRASFHFGNKYPNDAPLPDNMVLCAGDKCSLCPEHSAATGKYTANISLAEFICYLVPHFSAEMQLCRISGLAALVPHCRIGAALGAAFF